MFKLVSKYAPSGDQPKAIKELVDGIKQDKKHQVLMGATGTGKTFTIANVIKEVNKPTLVLAHNKTLAGQLYSELKELFPENRVEYFVSYYDYYQPEAYVPSTDTYIEKDASINDEIDELRHSATSALINRRDVIVVASVSCIYGIGEVEEYKAHTITLNVGDIIDRDEILKKLVEMLYERNNIDLKRGTFRVKGDVIELIPSYERTNGIRIEFFGDEIESIKEFLQKSIDMALEAGVKKEKIVLDPGIGFGKTYEQNIEVLNRLGELRDLGYPILLGTSRKSVLGKILEGSTPKERVNATVATTVLGVRDGVDIVRVHDVKENIQAAKVADKLYRG